MVIRWAAALGQRHGARARAASDASQAALDATAESVNSALSRWPRIVAAMTRLVAAYNQGFERDVLSMSEDRSIPGRPVVTILARAAGAPSLMVTLEESVVYARRSAGGERSAETEHRLRADRGDEATAAYVLQSWMESL